MHPILEKQLLFKEAVEALKQIAANTSEICLHLENIVQVIHSIHAQRYNMPSRWIADYIHKN